MGNREKLTVIIPVYNEAGHMAQVLESVAFADEIIVVDSYSTDNTIEIAKAYNPKIIQRKFDYHAAQKNWAIPQASNEWILLIDADERVTPKLENEILERLKNPPEATVAGFWIGRVNHFMGQRIYYSGWRNDKVIRLFRKSMCRYEDKFVHEEITTGGKVLFLKEKLLHYTYRSMDSFIEKLNRYATQQAKDYDAKTGRLTPYHFLIKPFWGFVKHYFLQSGFRDGVPGLVIGYIQAYTVFMRYVKLWLLRRSRD